MIPIRKYVDVSIKSIDRDKRQIRFYASVQELDRDLEVILTDGIEFNLDDPARRPKFCRDHDHTETLGKILSATRTTVNGVRALEMVAQFLPKGVSAVADLTYEEILFGARDSFSIGFLALEYDDVPVVAGQRGRTYRRVELLEVSSVVIPSCRGCVVTEKGAPGCRHCKTCRHDAENAEAIMDPIQSRYDAMDMRHVAAQLVESVYDRLDLRGPMGQLPPRPDFGKLEAADYVPPVCRGWTAMNTAQRETFQRQSRAGRGLSPLAGPGRSHGLNLGSSPPLEIDQRDLDAILGKLRSAIREEIAKRGPTIDRAIREAVTRARGRAD